MGLFDGWRRKKAKQAPVKLKEPEVPLTKVESAGDTGDSDDVVDLVADYERLIQRRDELLTERSELTRRLDMGEIEPDEFRKELMARIQEAASVSDKLRTISARLSAMGYRGVLH
ncbi:MAG: hypothetical protein ACTSV3_05510 [Candidatus Thorarchaeota archaeon]|nr:MAG: hypothetical protein DRP09_06555 [Candidatus Thorarchaeota archaeon]RLI59775.1 MAG: hypothetical protein DRO87_01825 [Candidatus Thorarchaeota archaeon]